MFDLILGIVLIILGLLLFAIKYKIVLGGKKVPVVVENIERQDRGSDEGFHRYKKMTQVSIDGKMVYLQSAPVFGSGKHKAGQKLEVYYNPKHPYEAVLLSNIGNEIVGIICLTLGIYLIFTR